VNKSYVPYSNSTTEKKKKLRTFWDVQLGKHNVIIIINSNKITPHVINDISFIAGLCYEETEGRGAGS
jgi:hypothetical protein